MFITFARKGRLECHTLNNCKDLTLGYKSMLEINVQGGDFPSGTES